MMTNEKLSEREEIESLLPWFAAGTLSRRDAERVERALKNDAELSRQFEMVREELGETIRVNESLGAPSTRALKSLFEKIDAEAPVARPRNVSLNLMARVSDFIAGFSPRTLAYAGTAAALAIVLQAAVITGNLISQPEGGNYRTVAIDHKTPAPAPEGTFAQIRFNPQATAADITEFLVANKATIAAGPSAGTGMYRVRVSMTGMPKEQLAEIVKRLQQDKVVGLAAPAE